jgi:cold shock CspA family protein
MAKSKETFNKREKERQRQKEKKEKREKMIERKANHEKGRSLDDMMAYVDENGNISSTPPDPRKKRQVNVEDIHIGVPKREDVVDARREGTVSYFDGSKGFGFILEKEGEKIFFHINQVNFDIKEGNAVSYLVERSPKGWSAVDIAKR